MGRQGRSPTVGGAKKPQFAKLCPERSATRQMEPNSRCLVQPIVKRSRGGAQMLHRRARQAGGVPARPLRPSEARFVGPSRSDVSMIRLALVLAVVLPLASSDANAQSSEGQQSETPAPGAPAPGAQPPEAQQPGAAPPEGQQPGAPPPGAQQPGAPPPGAQPPEAQEPGAEPEEQPNGPPRARPRGARFQAACQADLARFCSQLRPGGGRLWRCAKQHFPKLSPSCQRFFMTRQRQ